MTRTRTRFGLLVPFTNTNFEPDMALMCPDGVSLHATRMGGYDAAEIPDEMQMRNLGSGDLSEPLHLLAGVRPDVVLYGCTSATLSHGVAFDQDLAARIGALSGAQTVTAAGALVHALRSLDITRAAFASPYVPAINELAIGFLADCGITCVARADIEGVLDNDGQGALPPDAVSALACRADHPDAQAVILSCTDMRSVEVIAQLEARLAKPIITSNQAMLFQALQLAGLPQAITGFGTLLERPRL